MYKQKKEGTRMTKKRESFYRFVKVGLPIFIFMLLLQTEIAHASSKPTMEEAWGAFLNEYRIIIASIAGVGALTSILTFIFHFIKLGTVSSNPIERSKVFNNMLITAITTALLGAISVILAIFYNTVFSL